MRILRWAGFLTLVVGVAACDRSRTDDSARNPQRGDGPIATNSGSGTGGTSGAATAQPRVQPGELAPAGTSGTPAGAGGGTEPSLEHFAMMVDHAEIEISRLALQKARNPQVKQFAQQMVDDHTKAMTQQKTIGGSAPHQPAPTRDATQRHQLDADHQQLYDRLNGLSGDEFDLEYMRAMVADHQTAVARFHREKGAAARTTTADLTVDRWVEQTLPTLRKHLDRAQQLESRLEQPRSR